MGLHAFLFTDGFNTDAERLCANLLESANVVGGLSSGDLHTGHSIRSAASPGRAAWLWRCLT